MIDLLLPESVASGCKNNEGIDYTVELKNFGFTHRLSGHFSNCCGINNWRQIAS
jgi:hypothetical protein